METEGEKDVRRAKSHRDREKGNRDRDSEEERKREKGDKKSQR